MKITIIGAGAYALGLSNIINKENELWIWTKMLDEYNELVNYKTNTKVLKNYKINENIKVSNNLKEAIINSTLIIIALPTKYIEDTIKEMKKYITNKMHICIASKGIDPKTNLFPYQICQNYLSDRNLGIISGPSFAKDIIQNVPIGLTLATKNKKTKEIISLVFNNVNFMYTKDIKGVSLISTLKNIIALGSGIIGGLNYPESTNAMYLTKIVNDINKYYKNKTILSYAGIGDILLTCTSTNSRNYTLGYLIGKEENIDEYINQNTIEGLEALKIIDKNLNIPIINILYNIIYNNEKPNALIDYLFQN